MQDVTDGMGAVHPASGSNADASGSQAGTDTPGNTSLLGRLLGMKRTESIKPELEKVRVLLDGYGILSFLTGCALR